MTRDTLLQSFEHLYVFSNKTNILACEGFKQFNDVFFAIRISKPDTTKVFTLSSGEKDKIGVHICTC